jgi:hypothetical protein
LTGDLFARGAIRYRIGPLGPDWSRIGDQGGDLAFYNRAVRAGIVVQAECRRQDDAPLGVLAEDLLIGFGDVRVVEDTRVTLSNRVALHRVVEATLDGVPVGLDLYVLKRDGCAYTLVYTAPPDRFAKGEGDFVVFVAGFDVPGLEASR